MPRSSRTDGRTSGPHTDSTPTIVALDLEGTLISNAVTQFPRPGLRAFVEFCLDHFERVVVMTAVSETRARAILDLLLSEGQLPPEFADRWEWVEWHGKHKDLRFVRHSRWRDVLLVDDRVEYVAPGQRSQWVRVREFFDPRVDDEGELERVAKELAARIAASAN